MAEKNLKTKKTAVKKVSKAPVKTADAKPLQFAVGRRKRAIAKVRMFAGNGKITINEKPVEQLVPSKADLSEFMKPLTISGVLDSHDFSVKVIGGGSQGQLDAAKHGIARCIAKISDEMKKTMKQGGFLTRDPREKERKKIYHVRARKSPQYSKR